MWNLVLTILPCIFWFSRELFNLNELLNIKEKEKIEAQKKLEIQWGKKWKNSRPYVVENDRWQEL